MDRQHPKIITPMESPSSSDDEVDILEDYEETGETNEGEHAGKNKKKRGDGKKAAKGTKKSNYGVGCPSAVHQRGHLFRDWHNDAETIDSIKLMMDKEQYVYTIPPKYVVSKTVKGNGVTENWRRRLVEWMYDVVDHFGFDREAVAVAFDFVDRSVAMTHLPDPTNTLTKREYQLSAVTSLYLALKVHGEIDPDIASRMKLKISAFEELSRGFFSASTIEAKEMEILALFQWRVNPPTTVQFVSHFLRLLHKWTPSQGEYSDSDQDYEYLVGRIFDTAKYLTELAVFVSKFAFQYPPSTTAFGAILCAIDHLHGQDETLPAVAKKQLVQSVAELSDSLDVETSEQLRNCAALIKRLAPSMFNADIPTPTVPVRRTVSLAELEGGHGKYNGPGRRKKNRDQVGDEPCGGATKSTNGAPRALSPTDVAALDAEQSSSSTEDHDSSVCPRCQRPTKRRKTDR